MTKTEEIYKKLKAPFPANEIKWRAQQIRQKFQKEKDAKPKYEAIMLAYIDARAVMDRLDHAVGAENWQSEFTETPKGRIICKLSVKFGKNWVTKSDGAGETGTEGEKGAISDALKRAAVNFGINRHMYNFGDTRIDLEQKDIITTKSGALRYKWGAKKLSEKCYLPSFYLELLKKEKTTDKKEPVETKKPTETTSEALDKDSLKKFMDKVIELNKQVVEKIGDKSRNDNETLKKVIAEILEETKDDENRRHKRINAYLIKSEENALKVLNDD